MRRGTYVAITSHVLSTTSQMILAAVLVSAASAVVSGCAAQADQASNSDGHVDHVAQPIIRGGASGTENDSVVVLTTFQDGQRLSLCSATMVAPNLLVTARHCVSNSEGATACAQDGTAVTGGTITGTRIAANLLVFTGKNGVAPDSTVASNAVAHGKMVIVDAATNVCNHDVAFLLLDKDVDAPVSPIRMGAPAPTETVAAVGWGVDETGSLPTHREIRSGLALVGVGPAAYPNNPSWGYGDHEFMVGESACAGDSGSPAFAKSGALVGIAARTGNGQASDGNYATTCVGADAHSVYTHLGKFENLVNAAYKQAGHPVWLEGQPSPYATVQSTSGGTSSGATGSSGSTGESSSGGEKPAPVVKDSANADLLGGGGEPATPAPEAAASDNGGGGCSISSGTGSSETDNVAYAGGIVAFIAFLFGLRRRFRRADVVDADVEPPPPAREPYESLMM